MEHHKKVALFHTFIVGPLLFYLGWLICNNQPISKNVGMLIKVVAAFVILYHGSNLCKKNDN